MELKKEKK